MSGEVRLLITSKNYVICNHSLCDYVQLNVAYDYKWLPMRLFSNLDGFWSSFQLSYGYDLFTFQ